MRKALLILLFFSSKLSAQDYTVQVGVGEYMTCWRTNLGFYYSKVWNGSRNTIAKFNLVNVTDVDGAQYTCVGIADDTVFSATAGDLTNPSFNPVTKYPRDSFNVPFTGVTKVYGWFQTYLAIKNDSLYYWGNDGLTYGALNILGVGSYYITKPFKLGQPSGRRISKVVIGDQDVSSLIVLCTDGTVWTYTEGGGGTPVQKAGLSSVLDIGGISRACFVAATASDILAWGQFTSYVGLSDNVTTPTSILSQFTTAGLSMPLKQMGNNWNILALRDNDDSLFFLGDSPMGEAGNGTQINPWRTYVGGTSSSPFAWTFGRAQKLITTPYKWKGRVKNIFSGGSIAFYFFCTDMHDSLYSWGRGKTIALANGYLANNEATYPNWRDVPAPRRVNPYTVTFPLGDGPTFNPNDSLSPIASAGIARDVTTSSDSLYGDASSQQEHSIVGYAWTQISGPNTATIVSASSANTAITGLVTGTYIFQILVTNHDGQTDTDRVTIYATVNSGIYQLQFNRRRVRITP